MSRAASRSAVRAGANLGGGLAILTWVAVVLDLTGVGRAVLGLAFVFVPGVCLLLAGGVRDVAVLAVLGGALSMAVTSLVCVTLMYCHVWSVRLAVSVLALITLAAVAVARGDLSWGAGTAGADPGEVS